MFRVSRLSYLTTVIASIAYLLTPALSFAASLATPIVPQETCPLGYGAFFVVIQNVTNDAVILASVFIVLLIAYAGFLFVTSPASPSSVSKGRAVLLSAVIGFVIIISAWLIVNEFVMVLTTGNLQSITNILTPPSNTGYCLN